jgi:hypothetical protein
MCGQNVKQTQPSAAGTAAELMMDEGLLMIGDKVIGAAGGGHLAGTARQTNPVSTVFGLETQVRRKTKPISLGQAGRCGS